MHYVRVGEYDIIIPPNYDGLDKIGYIVETAVDIADDEGFTFVGFVIKKRLSKHGVRVIIYAQDME